MAASRSHSHHSGEHRRIIAMAVDESIHSDNAFHWYCDHVYKHGDFVVLIHIPENYDFAMASPVVVEQMIREINERVDNLQKKYRDRLLARRISGKFRSVAGKPGEKIVSTAKEEKAMMIITGTRGQGKLRRTILGSVSTYIIHHATIPVLVCRWKNKDGKDHHHHKH